MNSKNHFIYYIGFWNGVETICVYFQCLWKLPNYDGIRRSDLFLLSMELFLMYYNPRVLKYLLVPPHN